MGHSQGIVDDAADQMLPLPVEIKIKFRNRRHKAAKLRIQPFQIREKIRSQDNLSGHVQPCHLDLLSVQGSRFIHKGRRIWICPIIVFRHWRAVPMAFKAASHGHDPVHGKDCFRTVRKQAGQIGHGPQGDHGAGASFLSRHKPFF